ncbi:MAG: hypothetical protein EOO73_16365 [Myxococcales bacterium]|nr:MAG: hypothetical protein EOO73_16365 [Myxococcales bacterium]
MRAASFVFLSTGLGAGGLADVVTAVGFAVAPASAGLAAGAAAGLAAGAGAAAFSFVGAVDVAGSAAITGATLALTSAPAVTAATKRGSRGERVRLNIEPPAAPGGADRKARPGLTLPTSGYPLAGRRQRGRLAAARPARGIAPHPPIAGLAT